MSRIVILGLSITSSWGNGHATTYRALVRELAASGHDVLFLERDVPWYADNRDLPEPPYGRTVLYGSLAELKATYEADLRGADAVIVGSYVPEGVAVGEWITATAPGVKAFYDIDTPVTLAKLAREDYEYLTPALIPQYDLYLSFTGGPTLERVEREYRSPMARVLYCSVDPALYYPQPQPIEYDLGYLGTYGADRQPSLDELLVQPAFSWEAGRFVVAGPMYPPELVWPDNVQRIDHLAPTDHRAFYNQQRFTLNITRADMIKAGYSPSVRLFEAAACGTPIISDWWEGLETIFAVDEEILIARSRTEALTILRTLPESQRREIGARGRERVLANHTAAHRAAQLVGYLEAVRERQQAAPLSAVTS